MPGTSLQFDVDSAAVVVALSAYRAGVDDQAAAWRDVGAAAASAVQIAAPRRSGALAGSVQAKAAGDAVEITAGSSVVVYAGVQNYGWPARNIVGQHFLDEAERVIEVQSITELTTGLKALAARTGLT